MFWIALGMIGAGAAWAEDLKVTSNVHNGVIYVNGADSGVRTPGTVYGLETGRHRVRVVQGCYVGEAEVDVGTSGASLHLVASEQPGVLAVYPQPYDARVVVGGQPVSGPPGIPQKLACGEHEVEISAPRYASETLTAVVPPGGQAIVPVTLRRLALGSIEVAVTPATATILLDGRPVGNSSVLLPAVTEGRHSIGAEYAGKKSAIEYVVVEPDADLAFEIELVRKRGRKKSTVLPYDDPSERALTAADSNPSR